MHDRPSSPPRRNVLKGIAAAGTAALAGPLLPASARAQAADLGPYQRAKVNWRQAEGESITVAVIPASYFDSLIQIAPEFEALTGVKVRFEKIPPGQTGMIRINTMRGRSPGATSEPFGASGLGHGYGIEFLHELTRQKSVHWRSEPRPASTADMGPMAALTPRASDATP
jgi:hypothetical protein